MSNDIKKILEEYLFRESIMLSLKKHYTFHPGEKVYQSRGKVHSTVANDVNNGIVNNKVAKAVTSALLKMNVVAVRVQGDRLYKGLSI